MLNALWSRLHTLAPSLPPAPRVHLEVIGEPILPNLRSDPNIAVKQVAVPTGDYDAVISHSFLLAEGCAGALNETQFPNHRANLVRLRCAIGLWEERALQPSGSITYDLGGDSSQNMPAEKHDALRFFLQLIFRKRDFREGQLSAIARLLQGKPTIVLLPTGGGKSLIYQLTGLLLPGMTIVIDPIVALMNDQVANLRASRIDLVASISSSLKPAEKDAVRRQMGAGCLAFIFISPERLQSEKFRSVLRRATVQFSVSLAVIDEAHCVSEWGHDFRPSYLQMLYNLKRHCTAKNGQLPTLVGLTGTASPWVLADVQRELEIVEEEALIRPNSFDRPELSFEVKPVARLDKCTALINLIDEIPLLFKSDPSSFYDLRDSDTNSGIIFCPNVDGQLGVNFVASALGHSSYFAGRKPKDFQHRQLSWNEHKNSVQQAFKRNKAQEIVATKAFGMGIDKPNVRYTIHYTAPQSVEAFYQEAGRAGRDGSDAFCTILYSDDSWDAALEILDDPDHQRALETLRREISRDCQGDLLVQLYLLLSNYGGPECDKKRANTLLADELLPIMVDMSEGETKTHKHYYTDSQSKDEYVFYRLMLLGVAQDYSLDWQRKQFEVTLRRISADEVRDNLRQYLERYKFVDLVDDLIRDVPTDSLSSALPSSINVLVDFIYTEIVAQRKQALRTMNELCRGFTSDESFRGAILAYLQESELSTELRSWLGKGFDEIGLDSIRRIFKSVDNELAERSLLGDIRQMLDTEPENVALRYLSVFVRAYCNTESDSSVIGEARKLVLQADRFRQYLRDADAVIVAMLEDVLESRPALIGRISNDTLRRVGNASLSRRLFHSSLKDIPLIRSNSAKLLTAEALQTAKALASSWVLEGKD